MILNFFLILVLVALNGFFVAAEFAVITSRKTRVKRQADQGNPAASRLPARMLFSMPRQDQATRRNNTDPD